MTCVTPDQLVNSARPSGYNSVEFNEYAARTGRKPYRAQVYDGTLTALGNRKPTHGPRRSTGYEAAHDAAALLNGNFSAPLFVSKTTIDMGGAIRRKPKKQRKEPGRKQWPGETDFYFVAFYDEHDDNKVFRVSPGICATGDDRYLTLAKFFGLSVKALAPSILFPTRKDAEKHESAAIAKMDKDPAWEKTGKETYKPVKGMTV